MISTGSFQLFRLSSKSGPCQMTSWLIRFQSNSKMDLSLNFTSYVLVIQMMGLILKCGLYFQMIFDRFQITLKQPSVIFNSCPIKMLFHNH